MSKSMALREQERKAESVSNSSTQTTKSGDGNDSGTQANATSSACPMSTSTYGDMHDPDELRLREQVSRALSYGAVSAAGAGGGHSRDWMQEGDREPADLQLSGVDMGGLSATASPQSMNEKIDEVIAQRKSFRRKILHFSPSWFSVTMGTGVITTLFDLLGQIWGTQQYSPYFRSFMRWPALVFLVLDVGIFLLFSAVFIVRYIMFPQVFPLTVKHPQQSMFLGTIPMGLITITSGIAQLGTTEFNLGLWPTYIAVGLFFFDCLLCIIVVFGVPWTIVTYQKEHRFEGTTAALLLPVVPPITAAALASVITEILTDKHPTLAFTVMTVGYMQLGIGLPLALMILVLYLQRLILFKAPPREVIVSVFLPLGPCGQGGEASLHLGRAALALFPQISSLPTSGVRQLTFNVGEAMYATGMIGALLLFALGIWWAMMAVATFTLEWRRGTLKFNMGFWSFTFPLASLAICTARLAIELNSLTLKIVYTAFVLANFSLWVFVAIPTAKGFMSGDLLYAPCIANLPLDPLEDRHTNKKANNKA